MFAPIGFDKIMRKTVTSWSTSKARMEWKIFLFSVQNEADRIRERERKKNKSRRTFLLVCMKAGDNVEDFGTVQKDSAQLNFHFNIQSAHFHQIYFFEIFHFLLISDRL